MVTFTAVKKVLYLGLVPGPTGLNKSARAFPDPNKRNRTNTGTAFLKGFDKDHVVVPLNKNPNAAIARASSLGSTGWLNANRPMYVRIIINAIRSFIIMSVMILFLHFVSG